MLVLLFVATSSNMELAAGWPSYDLGQDVGRGGIRFRESKKSGRGGVLYGMIPKFAQKDYVFLILLLFLKK